MSFNRENVVWQSSNGLWNRGFYAVAWVDDDGDPEWDVEYDFDRFEWVSTGHLTEERAEQSWRGANPGGWTRYTQDDGSAACALFDKMAAEYKKRVDTRSTRW